MKNNLADGTLTHSHAESALEYLAHLPIQLCVLFDCYQRYIIWTTPYNTTERLEFCFEQEFINGAIVKRTLSMQVINK